MDIFEAIKQRRSIRKYTDLQIDMQIIRDVIEAGMYAPSAGNQQPWQFIVITEKDILAEIPKYHPHAEMIKNAAVGILICGDTYLEKHQGYWPQDCAACTQNILLAAHAKGLGAVWLGIYPRGDRVKKIQEFFGITEHIIPFSLISVGYQGDDKQSQGRFQKSMIRYNKWTV